MNNTSNAVIIAHDYLCPWCWIGLFQAKRLKEEFPEIEQDWRGFELLPESLGPLPEYKPRQRDPNAPPSRLQVLAALDGIPIPENRTIGVVRTRLALLGAEYVKENVPELFDAYNEGVYRAFWEHSRDISRGEVLRDIAAKSGVDGGALLDSILAGRYADRIVEFDDDARAADITHVPSFVFRGERCAEAPYSCIRGMAERFIAWYNKK